MQVPGQEFSFPRSEYGTGQSTVPQTMLQAMETQERKDKTPSSHRAHMSKKSVPLVEE